MNKVIRRFSLTLLTLILIAALSVFFLLDIVVERVIESKGSEIVGAKVELDSVDITFFPLGAELVTLQVTDPDRPMRNALEAGSIKVHLEASPLLSRKVIVDDLAVDRVRFNTPRETSGALLGAPAKGVGDTVTDTQSGKGAGVSGFRIPDVRSILEGENLRSVKLAQDLQGSVEERVGEWETRLTQLPNEQTFKSYEARINQLGKTQSTVSGVLGAATELQSIQGEISASLELIKSATSELRTEKSRFNDRLKEALRAPEQDFRELREKYGISASGFGNLTKLFLEDNLRGYVDTGLRWYGRIQPYLSVSGGSAKASEVSTKSKDQDSAVPDESGDLPDFLIRVATVSAELPWGQVKGRVDNVTDNQKVLGLPTVFNLGARELEGLKAFTLEGTYDELKSTAASIAFNLLAEGFSISDFSISENKDLPVLLKQGLGNLDINGSISGDQISSKVFFRVQDALFQTGKSDDGNDALSVISSALQQIDHLGLTADIAGTFSDYAVKLKSNLDGALRSAFESEAKRLAANFEKELRAGIREESAKYLDGATSAVSGLDGIGESLNERQALANALLGSVKKGGGGLKLPF